MKAELRLAQALDARQLRTAVLLALALPACMPDFEGLTEGVPAMGCEWSPVAQAVTEVPAGECWRVISLSSDLRLRLEGESCDAARECLTATAGERVVPLASLTGIVSNDDLEVVAWPCDELATACSAE
jgi:hypothetical protein